MSAASLLRVLAIASVCIGFGGIAVLVFVHAVRRRDRVPCEHCGTRDGHQ